MKSSFFKQYLRLRNEIIKARTEGLSEFSPLAVTCTKMIYTFMMSCKWHDTRRNRDLMTCIELPDSKAAEKMNISKSAVRSMRSVASRQLFAALGEDCFDIIHFGDSNAMRELHCRLIVLTRGYDDMSKLLPEQLSDKLVSFVGDSDKEFTVDECEHELMLIARYDLLAIDKLIDNVDNEKLAYIAEILIGAERSDMRSEVLKRIVSLSLNLSQKILK